AERQLNAVVFLRQHGLRPLLRPDSLVIPGDLLPLPPQNAPAQAITRGLLALASSGELKTREDVTGALTAAGFEVVRTTKNS
ncbi:hypothetical protein ACSLOR_29150, partial [Klebsiella pneumoniae]